MNDKNKITKETVLIAATESAYKKLDKTKPYSEQIDTFLFDIKLVSSNTEEMLLLTDAFKIACNFNGRITLTPVVLKLHEMHPEIHKARIRVILHDTFQNWLIKYHPDFKVLFFNIALIDLLKIFAKKFN